MNTRDMKYNSYKCYYLYYFHQYFYSKIGNLIIELYVLHVYNPRKQISIIRQKKKIITIQ